MSDGVFISQLGFVVGRRTLVVDRLESRLNKWRLAFTSHRHRIDNILVIDPDEQVGLLSDQVDDIFSLGPDRLRRFPSLSLGRRCLIVIRQMFSSG